LPLAVSTWRSLFKEPVKSSLLIGISSEEEKGPCEIVGSLLANLLLVAAIEYSTATAPGIEVERQTTTLHGSFKPLVVSQDPKHGGVENDDD
jgi:hypothetical protein